MNPAPAPACLPGQALIQVIRPQDGDPAASRALLCGSELERAARFRFPHDATAWITWRAGLRRILGGQLGIAPSMVPLQSTPDGKPHLAKPFDALHFNLSHSRDLAVVIICREGPVGIDLEPLDRAPSLIECAGDFCHPLECVGLPAEPAARAAALLELWVAKEAVLKALGTGLGFPPRDLRIEDDRAISDPPLGGLEGLKLASPAAPPGYQMAVAVPLRVDTFGLVDR